MKRILFLMLILGVLSASIYLYLEFKKTHDPAPNALNAVLPNSSLIIEIHSANTFWDYYRTSNTLQALDHLGELKHVRPILQTLDSIYNSKESLFQFLADRNLVMNQVPIGAGNNQWCFIVGIRGTHESEFLATLFAEYFGEITASSIYDGRTIVQLSNEIYYASLSTHFIISRNETALKEQIRHINNKGIKPVDENLDAAQQNAAVDCALTAYYRSPELSWVAVDVYPNATNIRMSGIVLGKDKKDQHLNGDGKFMLASIPSWVKDFKINSSSSFNQWIEHQNFIANKNGSLIHRNQQLAEIEDSCKCIIEHEFSKVLKGSFCLMLDAAGDQMISANIVNDKEFETTISKFSDHPSEEYKGFQIFNFAFPKYWNTLYPEADSSLEFITISNDFVFAGSRKSVKRWINAMQSGEMLINNRQDISQEIFGDGSELFWNTLESGSTTLPPIILNLSSNAELKGEFLAEYQNMDDGPQIFQWLYSPFENESTTTSALSNLKWELNIGELLGTQPYIIKNHYTKNYEVLIQDEENNLHLIGTAGKILWTKKLPGKIRDDLFQIDIYNNNKLQILCSTSNHIHCIDRNGKDVEGFPIKLPSKASSKVKAFDYDSNGKIRLVIGCEDGTIRNYNNEGKTTNGWKHEKCDSPIKAIQHFRIHGKDFILSIAQNGKTELLKRNGKSRFKTKAKALNFKSEPLLIVKGEDIQSSKLIYSTNEGNVVEMQFGIEDVNEGVTGLSKNSFLNFSDLNNDGKEDLIIIDGEKVKTFDSSYEMIFTTTIDSEISFPPQIFNFTAVDRKIGVVNSSQNLIYIIDQYGEISEGFPMRGDLPFLVQDLDQDGLLELIIPEVSGIVSCYKF